MYDQNPALAETGDIDEQIVAYLDGELDAAEAASVERRLSDDPQYRARLTQLERTWDLLDNLHRTEADDEFVNTTVAVVAVQAVEEAQTQRLRVVRRRRFGQLALAGVALAAALGTFGLVRWYATAENRLLVHDLPVIEHVDEYKYIDQLEFLKQLERENLFAAEADDEG